MSKNVLETFVEETGIQSIEEFYLEMDKWMQKEDPHSNALAIYLLQLRILQLLGDC